MQIEVYPSDADAIEAAAAIVAERLREAALARGRARAALGGGRPGRATMVALAARGDVPWGRVDWFLADERCTDAADPLAHAKVAQQSLFAPRGVAPTDVRAPRPDGAAPEDVAARYGGELVAVLGPAAVLDVVVLAVGADGALGALAPASAALGSPALVAVVGPTASDDASRVTLTAACIARARHVVVTAVGPDVAAAVRAALREGTGPAATTPPSERVAWIVDRDAAGELLKDARLVDA
jgi:6-phosphogluconolactonase